MVEDPFLTDESINQMLSRLGDEDVAYTSVPAALLEAERPSMFANGIPQFPPPVHHSSHCPPDNTKALCDIVDSIRFAMAANAEADSHRRVDLLRVVPSMLPSEFPIETLQNWLDLELGIITRNSLCRRTNAIINMPTIALLNEYIAKHGSNIRILDVGSRGGAIYRRVYKACHGAALPVLDCVDIEDFSADSRSIGGATIPGEDIPLHDVTRGFLPLQDGLVRTYDLIIIHQALHHCMATKLAADNLAKFVRHHLKANGQVIGTYPDINGLSMLTEGDVVLHGVLGPCAKADEGYMMVSVDGSYFTDPILSKERAIQAFNSVGMRVCLEHSRSVAIRLRGCFKNQGRWWQAAHAPEMRGFVTFSASLSRSKFGPELALRESRAQSSCPLVFKPGVPESPFLLGRPDKGRQLDADKMKFLANCESLVSLKSDGEAYQCYAEFAKLHVYGPDGYAVLPLKQESPFVSFVLEKTDTGWWLVEAVRVGDMPADSLIVRWMDLRDWADDQGLTWINFKQWHYLRRGKKLNPQVVEMWNNSYVPGQWEGVVLNLVDSPCVVNKFNTSAYIKHHRRYDVRILDMGVAGVVCEQFPELEVVTPGPFDLSAIYEVEIHGGQLIVIKARRDKKEPNPPEILMSVQHCVEWATFAAYVSADVTWDAGPIDTADFFPHGFDPGDPHHRAACAVIMNRPVVFSGDWTNDQKAEFFILKRSILMALYSDEFAVEQSIMLGNPEQAGKYFRS